MLNRGDIIELNGIDEYVVGDIFSDLSKVFLYLIDNEEPTNVKFGIMDQLCEAGVVGPEEGTKPRKILMTKQQFEEYLDGAYSEEQ